MRIETRDQKEAAAVAHEFLNLSRCVGGHIIASGFRCTHCESFDPQRECYKENIDLTLGRREEEEMAKKAPEKAEPKKDVFIEYTFKCVLPLKAIEGGDASLEMILERMREDGAAEVIGREIYDGTMTWDEAYKQFHDRWGQKGLV